MFLNNKEIQSCKINDNATIYQVLKVLNKSKLIGRKICIIEDKNKKLVNILTDGDLRRILLKEQNLNKPIKKYLKKKLLYFKEKTPHDEIVESVAKKDLFFAPILDKKKKIKKIYYKKYSIKTFEKKYDNEILILAGGRGQRMFPLTDIKPKPLLQIGNFTILETLIEHFSSQGFYNFSISINYKHNDIINFIKKKNYNDLNIKFLLEKKKLGTAGPMTLLKKFNQNLPVVVINGDIYTRLNFSDLIKFHKKTKSDLTVCSHFYEQDIPYGLINKKKNEKIVIKEKPIFNYEISAGIYLINPRCFKKTNKNKFLNMNDFVNNSKKNNFKIKIFPIHELWMDIGDHGSFYKAQNHIENEW